MRLMDKIVKEDRSEENLNNIRTIQVNSPHEHNHILQTYTPQPSTPIKHAGSELLIGDLDINKEMEDPTRIL